MLESQGTKTEMKKWTRPTLTGQSLAETVHQINWHVNALHAAHHNEPKVMVGRAGNGWTLTNIRVNGTTRTVEYADEQALKYALNRRLMRVRRIAGELRKGA